MVGSLLAGTDETPGEVFLWQGRSYKAYRGMGSVGAMARGSADRYFQQDIKDTLKLVPEGIEGQVPYKGPVGNVCISSPAACAPRWAMSARRNLAEFHEKAQFVRITGAGLRESHVHDVTITRESPNYP
jgi:IMP dehydrogenase